MYSRREESKLPMQVMMLKSAALEASIAFQLSVGWYHSELVTT